MNKPVRKANFFDNFRKYFIIKKIQSYTKGKSRGIQYGAEILSILLLTTVMVAGYFLIPSKLHSYWFLPGILVVGVYLIWVMNYIRQYNISCSGIQKLIMKDEEGRNVKEWYVEGKKSLLIGRKTQDNEVDIDLSESEYVTLISKQHAVLNFSDNVWYIEDIGSSNGTSLKKISESKKSKLEQGTLYKIGPGDTIYIANTRLVVK